MRTSRIASAAIAILMAAVPAAMAQTRSSFTGTITDTSGAVMPGVSIVLESPDLVGGAQSVTTDERGAYRFSDLPPGTYSLTASLSGFQSTQRTNIRLLFGTTLTVDMSLRVGGNAETVTVEGRSPTVDVTTARSTVKIDSDLIENAPTVTDPRNGVDIMSMAPGIVSHSAFGGARDANEILFDGTPTTLPERQGTNSAVVNPTWMDEVQV